MGATSSVIPPSGDETDLALRGLDQAISRQLVDKMYEKRKAAALDLEKCVIEISLLYLPSLSWLSGLFVNAMFRMSRNG